MGDSAASIWVSAAVALIVSAGTTALLVSLSKKINLYKNPSENRWHKQPTPFLGGVAIYIGLIFSAVCFLFTAKLDSEESHIIKIVLVTSSSIFLLGLVDDFLKFNWKTKLFWQFIAAITFTFLALAEVNFFLLAIAILWTVLISNCFNLIDNIDSLAGGISVIVGFSLFFLFFNKGDLYPLSWLPLFLAFSVGGFLIFNISPAKIFMGDSGSLLIGYFLSTFAVVYLSQNHDSLRDCIAIGLVFLIPIADTMFVVVRRLREGRSIMQGGRDHLSHTLVAYGFSETRAVALLLSLAILFSGCALVVI